MSNSWKEYDLAGEGLQTINLQMTRQQKSLSTAIICWCFFPLGVHQLYLQRLPVALLYLLLTVFTAALLITALPGWQLTLALLVGLNLWDLFRLPLRVARYNKNLKMKLYLQQSHAPPEDFRGRYTDDSSEEHLQDWVNEKEQERGGHHRPDPAKGSKSKQRIMSFAEQEALLKQMQETRKKDD